MKKWKSFYKRFWDAFWRPEMLVLPGQITFSLFLSVVPTITLIGYVCSYLNISNELISTLISNGIGSNFADMLTPIITDTKITPTFFITLGVGYFIAANGMSSIIVASNTIYGIKNSGFFKRRLKALIMELILVVLLLFIIVVPLLGDTIINIFHYFNLSASTTSYIIKVFRILKIPFSVVFIFIFIKTIYTMSPDKKVPSKSVTGGALFTTAGWILSTYVYSFYINKYANYSVFYGSLANIVILILWVYLLSYILVIGMALNYHEELEKTGIIEIKKAIAESANQASVFPESEEKKSLETKIIEQVTKRIDKKEKEEPKDELKEEIKEEKNEEKKVSKKEK